MIMVVVFSKIKAKNAVIAVATTSIFNADIWKKNSISSSCLSLQSTIAAEVERNAFIHANMAEYKRLFFPQPSQHKVMTDTFICDNGGFENNFDFYYGFSSTYTSGSKTCTPIIGGLPSVFVPRTLPTLREFEIVTTGTDAITGLQKVKFGNKSLKLNDPYNHDTSSSTCSGSLGVNKLEKRFLVTEDNRDVTVWYSIAIENPVGHNNTQPFFSISCDLAPLSDLCFDADILSCDSTYSQPGCIPQLMDVLDWSCHRIKIPRTEIGQIATLEIVMGDCGLSVHNGYAYIDGICEDCVGGALGSMSLSKYGVDYVSCNGDIARVCGSYIEPFVCGEWYLDSIFVGDLYFSTNEVIDTVNKTFCFDFNISNLGLNNTIDIYVSGLFKRNGGGRLPIQFSNNIEIDKLAFETKYDVEHLVSECHDNGTPNNISDDYYFVSLTGYGLTSEAWDISRELDDPYDNESGVSSIGSGAGPFSLNLGPFFIQEGSWDLILNIGECTYIIPIEPLLCQLCGGFKDIQISNVKCSTTTPGNWSFDLLVEGTSSGYYQNSSASPLSFGTLNTITLSGINLGCVRYELEDASDDECTIEFTVCPPKPCTDTKDCTLEFTYDIECVNTMGNAYSVTFDVTNIGPNYLCIIRKGSSTPTSYTNNTPLGISPGVSPEFTVFTCSRPSCTDCAESCFKTVKIFQPDCASGDFDGDKLYKPSVTLENIYQPHDALSIVPNPIDNNELRILSKLDQTSIEIYNTASSLVHQSTFLGSEYKWNMTNVPSGIYFVKYKDLKGELQIIKFLKY